MKRALKITRQTGRRMSGDELKCNHPKKMFETFLLYVQTLWYFKKTVIPWPIRTSPGTRTKQSFFVVFVVVVLKGKN